MSTGSSRSARSFRSLRRPTALTPARRADPSLLSERARRDAELRPEIRRVWRENFEVYGVRKVWRQLNREGVAVARCTVARLMTEMGMAGAVRGKPVKTTVSNAAAPCPEDRVNREFHAPRPNTLWLSDFTYVAPPGPALSTLPS